MPRFKGEVHTIPKICPTCGNTFNTYLSQNRTYCSLQCYHQGGQKHCRPTNKVTKKCSWCGEDVTRPASNFHSDKVFCNYQCMAEWQSEFQNGKSHPRWKGGTPERYGFTWYKARKDTLTKANYICQKCHKSKAAIVHHLLPVRFFNSLADAHFPSNLIALCRRCHSREHKRLASALPLLDLLNFQIKD